MTHTATFNEAKQKLEHYCAYQDRCHQEVVSKLYDLGIKPPDLDEVVVHLIAHNFLNEERFACSFARGKHRIKHWGKIRIVNELKFRNISQYNINTALKEITPEEYAATFHRVTQHQWESIRETNVLKKRKKFCDYFLRKGFESNWVYEKMKELENSETE
ncbi:regulatory protein RecX [Flavobacterium psychrotolerans]|uniref:Regulatory protein RecX n=1 Tax=Flavobacterium psychrotolerans TaxID=2169410 RepID=A0A2U1JJ64_9FLAO|nr:regulatory protein RecX [Flavobacterium psychrotolerans]PWA05182.1 recombinase RecX [Flavobacterium psychrotolerans]